MDIRIGIVNAPREVYLAMPDGTSIDDVKASIDAAVASNSMVWLTDKKDQQTGFPSDRIAYVQLGTEDENSIGFG